MFDQISAEHSPAAHSPAERTPAERSAVSAGTPLDVEPLICVSRPYFALEGLRQLKAGEVVAGVPVETDPGLQASVIGVGEVGRHLAILGLCAAATINPRPGRHFYLARSADLEWLAPPVSGGSRAPHRLTGRARAEFTALRRAEADTELTDDTGKALARMNVVYDVMPYPVVTRLLGDPVPTEPPSSERPYARTIPLGPVRQDGKVYSSELPITADLCPGHFDGYPVLPVAVLATAMTTLIDRVADLLCPGSRWLPGPLHLRAEGFARAGQTVVFELVYAPAGGGHHCTARVGGQTVAAVTMESVEPIEAS